MLFHQRCLQHPNNALLLTQVSTQYTSSLKQKAEQLVNFLHLQLMWLYGQIEPYDELHMTERQT